VPPAATVSRVAATVLGATAVSTGGATASGAATVLRATAVPATGATALGTTYRTMQRTTFPTRAGSPVGAVTSGQVTDPPAVPASVQRLLVAETAARAAVQRDEETVADVAPPEVPAEPAAEPVAPATATAAAAPPVPPGAGSTGGVTDVDALVTRLYDPLVRRLKAELRLDRERAGHVLDLRQ
jgi:hypothetical protein